jgi:hypothetical protein
VNDETNENRDTERLWEDGWDGHESAQRLRMADWTVARKLQWLTEVNALARRILGPDGFQRVRRRALGLDG